MQDDTRLSILEAYRTMLCFLEDYYNRTHSEEVGILLGGLSLNQDGEPMDPGYLQEWMSAVEKVRNIA
jgi:hypothetical protein